MTLRLLGVHRIVLPREDLGRGRYHHGRMDGRIVVNAPWRTLRVRGFRVPFVVDAQGTEHDADALGAILGGRLDGGDEEAGDEAYDEQYDEAYEEELG